MLSKYRSINNQIIGCDYSGHSNTLCVIDCETNLEEFNFQMPAWTLAYNPDINNTYAVGNDMIFDIDGSGNFPYNLDGCEGSRLVYNNISEDFCEINTRQGTIVFLATI